MKINNRLRILKYFIIQWVVKIMYKDAEKDKDAGNRQPTTVNRQLFRSAYDQHNFALYSFFLKIIVYLL